MQKTGIISLTLLLSHTAAAAWPNSIYKCREFVIGSNEQSNYHAGPAEYYERLLSTRFFPQEMIRPHNQSLFLGPSERSGGHYSQIDLGDVLTSAFKSKNKPDDWGYLDTRDNEAYFLPVRNFDKFKKDISSQGGALNEVHGTNVLKSAFSFDPLSDMLFHGIVNPKNVKISYFNFNHYPDGKGPEDVVAEGLLHAYKSNKSGQRIHVLNMSLRNDYFKYACQSKPKSYISPDAPGFSQLALPEKLANLFHALERQDQTMVVFSAGNDSRSVPDEEKRIENYFGKCKYSNWIFVSNLERDSFEELGRTSNRGALQDFATIGTNVYFDDTYYHEKTPGEGGNDNVGTSFSAPQVSGVVLTIGRVNPSLSSSQVKQILSLTASGITKIHKYGKGIPNLVLASKVARAFKGKPFDAKAAAMLVSSISSPQPIDAKVSSMKRPEKCELYPAYYDELLNAFHLSGRKSMKARHALCQLYTDLLLVGPKMFLGCHQFSDTRISLNDIKYFNEQVEWGHVPSFKELRPKDFTPAPVKVKEHKFEIWDSRSK